jgi:hypothetical protein
LSRYEESSDLKGGVEAEEERQVGTAGGVELEHCIVASEKGGAVALAFGRV